MNYYRSGQVTQEFMTFFVLVGCIAALIFLAVRGVGLPTSPPPSEHGPLVIQLIPEETHCIARLPDRGSGLIEWYNEDGEVIGSRYIYGAWFGVTNYTMSWQVRGGEEPYEVEIDGERASAYGVAYVSHEGEALLGCLLKGGNFLWHGPPDTPRRMYHSIPNVESNWKTVKATVRDADGRTAEANAEVYVVVDLQGKSRPILRKGRTYLFDGHILTAPSEYDIQLSETSSDGSLSYALMDVDAGVVLLQRDYRELDRWHRGSTAQDPQTSAKVDRALDEFVESVGDLPQRNPSPPSTFADGDH